MTSSLLGGIQTPLPPPCHHVMTKWRHHFWGVSRPPSSPSSDDVIYEQPLRLVTGWMSTMSSWWPLAIRRKRELQRPVKTGAIRSKYDFKKLFKTYQLPSIHNTNHWKEVNLHGRKPNLGEIVKEFEWKVHKQRHNYIWLMPIYKVIHVKKGMEKTISGGPKISTYFSLRIKQHQQQ